MADPERNESSSGADANTMEHPRQLCRLCAQSNLTGKLLYMFHSEEDIKDDLALSELINVTLPIKVSQMDQLPKQVCELCAEKVQAFHEFAVTCVAAEQELLKMSENNEFRSSAPALCIKGVQGDASSTVNVESVESVFERSKEGKQNEDNSNVCYSCPLCCEGEMGCCVDEPIEALIRTRSKDEFKSYEEELMEQHRLANEVSNAALSDEDDIINDPSDNDIEYHSDNEDSVMIDDQDDEDFKVPSERRSAPKTSRQRNRGKRRGRGKILSKNKIKRSMDESDTLMWIKATDQQTVPLIQCVQCSGWLPGFASCLQHALTSHLSCDESGHANFLCPRCEEYSTDSQEQMLTHYTKSHCPNVELEIKTENGELIVVDEGGKIGPSDIRQLRNIIYQCTICEKGYPLLLSLLQHSCTLVDCSNMHCDICSQQYRNRQRYVFHMFFHRADAPPLECDVCLQSFSNDTLLYDHVRFAHSDENFVCDDCGKCFRSEKGLASHQLSAHSSDPSIQNRHKCTQCGKGYRDKQGLREHLVTHMAEKPYQCDKCHRAYNRHSRLKQHQMGHLYTSNMNCYECVNCGLAFPDEERALQHTLSENHEVQEALLNKVYRCEFCDTVFSCPDGLNLHRPQHSGEKPYVCPICGASFHTYSRVTTHKTTHGIYDQVEPREGDFTIPRHFLCEQCGLSYPYYSYLQTHRKMRHSENPFSLSCKLCPEKFKNSWSVLYHRKKVHEGNGNVRPWRRRSLQCQQCGVSCMYQHTLDVHIERKHGPSKDEEGKRESYQCEECGKVFKYQTSLLIHQKMHQGHKNFQCEQCDKSFLTMATLRNHTKRCHQGVKPHQCMVCGKAFFHKSTRDDHLRLHTGEKPFQCEFCNKSFRLKSMLTDHSKIHNDHRPYPCDICGSSFRRMVHMKQHRMLHTGEKPFQCDICETGFRLKQELQRHLKAKHGENSVLEEDDFILGE